MRYDRALLLLTAWAFLVLVVVFGSMLLLYMPELLAGHHLTPLGEMVVLGGWGIAAGLTVLMLLAIHTSADWLALVQRNVCMAAGIVLLIAIVLWTKWSIFVI